MVQKNVRKNIIIKIRNSVPYSILMIGILTWYGLRYNITLNQPHLEWLLLIAMGLSGWCCFQKLRFISILLFSCGLLLSYYLFISLPSWQQKLEKLAKDSPSIWIQGTIVQANKIDELNQLHLSDVKIFIEEKQEYFPEIFLYFPIKRSTSRFYRNRSLQVAGVLKKALLEKNRLTLYLEQTTYHDILPASSSWYYFGKIIKQHLMNRAQFYLSNNTFSIYAPVILGQTRAVSESVQLFRNSGMAHLLAISGLHIGLLFWLGVILLRQVGRLSTKLLLWVHFPRVCQFVILFGLWGYLVLIGFPIPAMRALLMFSILVISQLSGQTSSLLSILLITAFLLICQNPAVIYNLSFQLSFVAVYYIFLILPLLLKVHPLSIRREKFIKFCSNSFMITGGVLIGLGPILLTHFKMLALEAFWLNLIMMPLLAFIILPLCFLAFIISLFYYNALPYFFIERSIFQLAEWALELWLRVLKFMHHWGEWTVLYGEIEWEGWQYLAYYLSTIIIFRILIKFKKSKEESLFY